MELMILSKLVDEYTVTRQNRLDADKHARTLKAKETELKDQLLGELITNEVGSVGGSTHTVKRQTKKKPQVAEWPEFYEFMLKEEATQLLQRRLNEGAVKEMVEDGVHIPGIEYYEVNDLSVSKL